MYEMADAISDLSDEIPQMIAESMDHQLEVAVQAIKASWLSHTGKGTDFVYNSIGKNIGVGGGGPPRPNPDGSVSATVGVFKIDHVAASFGRRVSKKDGSVKKLQPSAPQVAWWHENGTKNITASHFLSSAFYSSLPQQEKAFQLHFDKAVGRILKG
tara:strand:- start:9470 stop:9940 length:471 start_codon:yes stop_codon:yes gene_type:complete